MLGFVEPAEGMNLYELEKKLDQFGVYLISENYNTFPLAFSLEFTLASKNSYVLMENLRECFTH